MKTTQYFRYTRQRPDRAIIKEEGLNKLYRIHYEGRCGLMDEFENGRESLQWKIAHCV